MDCDAPVRFAVSEYGEPFHVEVWRCRDRRASRCGPCSGRHRRRVFTVASEGMHVVGGAYYLATLTAPSDVGDHCLVRDCDGLTCSHPRCRCTPPGGVDLGEWNPTAAKRWNHFLTLVERHYGSRPSYFRGVEVQDGKRRSDQKGRGALHLHILMRSDQVLDEKRLRGFAMDAGFGHELVLDQLTPGSKAAAYYVSKYVSKASDMRVSVPWSAPHTDPYTGETFAVDAPATYRTWSQSRTWGRTLEEIRAADAARYSVQEQLRLLQKKFGIGVCDAQPPAGPEPDD